MKKKLLSAMFVCGVILIGLFLLVACQPRELEPAASVQEQAGVVYAMDPTDMKLFNAAETSPSYIPPATDSVQQGNEANVARYIAMGKAYTSQLTSIQQGNEANVARYIAMGKAYTSQPTSIQQGNEANVARYIAMGKAFTSQLISTQ